MLEVRSEIIEFSSTPTAPWMLQLETLQSLRGALQELLTVSTFDEQGRSEPGVEKVAMCRGIVPRGRPLLAAAAACLPATWQCFPFTCGTLAGRLADFVTPQAISAALDITAVQTKVCRPGCVAKIGCA